MKVLFSVFLVTFSFLLLAQESLHVSISNLENNKGQVILLLFNNEKEFGIDEKPYKKYSVSKLIEKKATFIIKNLPQGEYAFLVFHDENKNEVFARNWLGMPKEGIGKSGLQHKRPNYKNSKFTFLGKTLVFKIDLKYLL
jgi:uncharacterized protein (DUF2141 family)